MKNILAIGLLIVITLIGQTSNAESLSGSYRCWHFNVDGGGGKCTSPPIIFYSDGRYKMSSESGTYSVSENKVTLSESKHRGAGTISGEQVQFEYNYKGKHYTVTYLHQGGAAEAQPSGGGITQLDLTISCAGSGSAVDWINTCSLDCGDGNRYDALAVQKDRSTLNCWHRQVPPNKTCSVSVSSGLDSRTVGSVQTTGSVKKTVHGQCAW